MNQLANCGNYLIPELLLCLRAKCHSIPSLIRNIQKISPCWLWVNCPADGHSSCPSADSPAASKSSWKKKKKKPEPRKLGCGQIPRHHTENHLMIYVAWLTARGQVNKMCRLPRPAAKEQARCDCPQRLPKARRGQAEQRGAELHLQCSGGLCSSVQASRLRNANFLLIGNSSDSCA